jgi:hypothetical protein
MTPTPEADSTSRPTILSMDLTGVPATLVAIRFGPWRLNFLVDRDAPPETLRDLEATARWIRSTAAA